MEKETLMEENLTETLEEKIYEIEIKMQEIDSKLEMYEDSYYNGDDNIFPLEEYDRLKQEYKELKKQKKALLKENKQNSFWDKVPVWMVAYGIFQIIFSFFFVISMVSILFSSWFLGNVITKSTKFWEAFSFFFIPFISLLISTIIFLLIKDKLRKKIFLVIFSIQGIETIVSAIIMATYLVKVWNS